MKSIYYVYALINPATNQPFYIGKGKEKRAWSHLTQGWDKFNPRKSLEIKQIRKDKLEPTVNIIKENMAEQDALNYEKELIKQYGRQGYETNGILTNITKGGYGGNTSEFFTADSCKKMSRPGIKNPMAKLTEEQVVEIYYSKKERKELSKQYSVGENQITEIKRKISYKNVTEKITDLPGVHPSCKRIPLSYDTIQCIYLEEGSPTYFKETYNLGMGAIYNIKERRTYVKITEGLGTPGDVKKYNLTPTDVDKIFMSKESLDKLAKQYNVHKETIRNIKKSKTRVFD